MQDIHRNRDLFNLKELARISGISYDRLCRLAHARGSQLNVDEALKLEVALHKRGVRLFNKEIDEHMKKNGVQVFGEDLED